MTMLIPVKKLDHGCYGYAPEAKDAVVNTDHIVSIERLDPANTRRSEPCVGITLTVGGSKVVWQCIGTPADFLPKEGD